MKNIHSKKLVLIQFIVLTFITSMVFGCKSAPNQGETKESPNVTPQSKISRSANEISVMTFNVENTFDNIHNEGVEDYTYLPRSQKNTPVVLESCNKLSNSFYKSECLTKNWDDKAVEFKLSQVAKVISYVDDGKGPDNLLLVEVENINILSMLVKNHLKALGYKTIAILKGPDTRGINTAFISKFPMVGQPILHLIPYRDADPEKEKQALKSRGILEVTVKINSKEVSFLSAHFPSQSNPTEWRKQAIEHMKTIMLDIQNKGRAVIAGGDLNVTKEEESDHEYFSKILSLGGSISHFVGCKTCKGTHSYKGGWSFLDVLVFGNNLSQAAGLSLIPESIEVVKAPNHVKQNGTPLRFDEIKKEGVSDHFPLYARLKIL